MVNLMRVFHTFSENNALKRQFTNLDRHYISEIGSMRCHWTFLFIFSRARKFVRWHSRDVATWSYSPTKGSFSLIRRGGVEKRWHSRLSRTQASKYFKSALQVKSKLQSLDCFFNIKRYQLFQDLLTRIVNLDSTPKFGSTHQNVMGKNLDYVSSFLFGNWKFGLKRHTFPKTFPLFIRLWHATLLRK